MRDVVRDALETVAIRFSDDAPSIDTRVLRSRYRAYESWPADCELALVLLAWILGPGFKLPGFREALDGLVPDFESAASAVAFRNEGPTLITLGGIIRHA